MCIRDSPLTMFDHVYAELPPDLQAEREELRERLEKGAPRKADEEVPPPLPMRGQRKTSRWQN